MMPTRDQVKDIPSLIKELTQGNRGALSRLLTLAGRVKDSAPLPVALRGLPKSAVPIVALTGSGGVGKSSLLGALAARLAARGKYVGILACDPESPITGGALLGDRCRIAGTADSERIFIRSLPTAAGRQSIAQNIELMLDVMRQFGFDHIFVETVGAGQGDVAVRKVADKVVLVLQPQIGDSLQWEKAGILEVADIIVVNKCDLPGADRTVAEIVQQAPTSVRGEVRVVKTSVALDEGIEELCDIITGLPPGEPTHPGFAKSDGKWMIQ